MKIDVLTLFPEMFTGVFSSSILKKAAEKEAATYHVTNFRDFSNNKHKTVDDYPYGGGAGMVLSHNLFSMLLLMYNRRAYHFKSHFTLSTR